jgi:hypothetical protein
LVDAYHVPKLLSQQLLLFGRSGDGLEGLTFEVELVSALSARRGQSASWWRTVRDVHVLREFFMFLLAFVFVWQGFGRSACSGRTVRVLPADGPLFAVRLWRFCCLFRTVHGSGRTVRGKGADSPRYPAGQSAQPLRTVHPAWPDSPPEPGCFSPWFDSFLLSFVLPRVL